MNKEDRATRWTRLLKLDSSSHNHLKQLNEDFKRDHPDQLKIHNDCQQINKMLPMFEEAELKDYLELLLTYYCKTENISYISGMHEVLAAFFVLGFSSLKTVYAAFREFVKKMMPRVFKKDSSLPFSYKIFYKLLLYHEPVECSALDGKMLHPQAYAERWFLTLFASALNISLLLAFWEFCLQENNPTLPYFFALVCVSRIKEKILSKKNLSMGDVQLFRFYINELDELDEICQEALALQHQTPSSFISIIEELVLHRHSPEQWAIDMIDNSVSLPILSEDVKIPKPGLFIIDLRSLEEYTEGHYPQAFNFPKNLNLTTGTLAEELWNILSGFSANFTSTTTRPCHFAFCSDTKSRHIRHASTLCLDVIRRGIERVSILPSGYAGDSKHDWEQCQWCELNRDLVISSEGTSGAARCNLIRVKMWNAFLHEVGSKFSTPFSSQASSPRFIEPSIPRAIHINTQPSDSSSKPTTTARSTEIDTSSFTIQDSLKLMWTLGIQDSEHWFEERKNFDSRCALHWAEAGFLKALLMGDKPSRKIALERLEIAEKIADAHVKSTEASGNRLSGFKGKGSPELIFNILKDAQNARMNIAVLAEVYLFKAGSDILHRDYPKGSIHFRNAWKQHKICADLTNLHNDLEKNLPEHYKNQLASGIEEDIENLLNYEEGIFLLSLSMAPTSLLRLAKLAGMEANQSKGVQLLYKCINSKRGMRVPLALMFMLFWLLVYIPEFVPGKEERYREANELIKFGSHYYSKSIYFSWLESYMLTKQGNLERSLKLLDRALVSCEKQGLPFRSPRLLFEKGWVLFLCQEWEEALACLLSASDHSPPSPFTQLLLGACSCMTGQLDQAEEWFQGLGDLNLERSTIERWIGRRAKRYLNRRWFQLFPYEIIYVTDYLNGMKRDWFEHAFDFLSSIGVPEIPNPESLGKGEYQETDEYSLLLLLQASILRNFGRLREAVKMLEKLTKYQSWILNEKWVIPHAYYELGLVYMRGRDWRAGSDMFLKAKMYKKYDFRRSLNFKLNAALEFIAQEESKENKRG